MPDKLKIKIITPEKVLWEGESESVKVLTLSGEIEILPGHSKILTVVSGYVRTAQKEIQNIKGLLWAEGNRVTLFAE